MQILKSRHVVFTLLLAMILCMGCCLSAAAATDYELEKIYLYDYSDMDDRIVLDNSDIRDSMSQVVDWQTIRIRATVSDGDYEIQGANLEVIIM